MKLTDWVLVIGLTLLAVGAIFENDPVFYTGGIAVIIAAVFAFIEENRTK